LTRNSVQRRLANNDSFLTDACIITRNAQYLRGYRFVRSLNKLSTFLAGHLERIAFNIKK